MKDYLTFLLTQIVSKPEEIEITEELQEELYLYHIKVSQEDMGKVIGKAGKTINALRELAKVKAIKDNIRVRIELVDQNPNANI